MKNKGFTLIELVVVIIILGIIIAFALPNITSNMERNKKDAFLNDAKDMIEKTQILIANNPAFAPDDDEISVFTLNFIDKKENIKDSEYGLPYNRSFSFVTVEKKENKYEYKVSLLACKLKEESETVTILDSDSGHNSVVAARLIDNEVIQYDYNDDGYIDKKDIDKIGTEKTYKLQTCDDDYDEYYIIELSIMNDITGDDKYKKVETKYASITSNRTSYINDKVTSISEKIILPFYY